MRGRWKGCSCFHGGFRFLFPFPSPICALHEPDRLDQICMPSPLSSALLCGTVRRREASVPPLKRSLLLWMIIHRWKTSFPFRALPRRPRRVAKRGRYMSLPLSSVPPRSAVRRWRASAPIREEVRHQERLEATGYRSPTWKVLRALQSLRLAVQLQGESAVTAPPFFPSAGRGMTRFWGNEQGPTVFLWDGLGEEGREECERVIRTETGLCGAERSQ
jgi:hypothetical protein